MTPANRHAESLRVLDPKVVRRFLSLSFVMAAIGFASIGYIGQSADAAKPKIMDVEQAWKLEKSVIWDSKPTGIHALIQSQLRVDNVTGDVIYGRITDVNGTVIGIYGKESVIMARFGYVDGAQGKWQIVTKPSNGLFSFVIPPKYVDADYVNLWVNPNSFSIRPGTHNPENNTSSYYEQGTEIEVNNEGIFVVRGAPPLSFIDVSSDEGLHLQHFPVYQGSIDAKVTSAQGLHYLNG